jgi:hypothetical protein
MKRVFPEIVALAYPKMLPWGNFAGWIKVSAIPLS